MGTDKALLARAGQTLVEYMAIQVRQATGNVTIVADPARYSQFGFPVVADQRPGCGPLGGLLTALETAVHPWSLITACDMPNLDATFLETLLAHVESVPRGCECIVPVGPLGPEPLCALYHRVALEKVRTALDRNMLKMKMLITSMEALLMNVPEGSRFRNINTPEDWAAR